MLPKLSEWRTCGKKHTMKTKHKVSIQSKKGCRKPVTAQTVSFCQIFHKQHSERANTARTRNASRKFGGGPFCFGFRCGRKSGHDSPATMLRALGHTLGSVSRFSKGLSTLVSQS